jgi:hypothetical protein
MTAINLHALSRLLTSTHKLLRVVDEPVTRSAVPVRPGVKQPGGVPRGRRS